MLLWETLQTAQLFGAVHILCQPISEVFRPPSSAIAYPPIVGYILEIPIFGFLWGFWPPLPPPSPAAGVIFGKPLRGVQLIRLAWGGLGCWLFEGHLTKLIGRRGGKGCCGRIGVCLAIEATLTDQELLMYSCAGTQCGQFSD